MKNKNFDGYNSIFATRFRKLIETRKDTQSNISKTLKIARQTVSMYYNGETIPTADKLYQIAVYFNVSADYLLGLTGEPAADEVVRAMCEETGLHSAAIESLLEKKKESDFLKVSEIVDLIFTSNNFSFKDIILYMNAYRDSINEIEIRLKENLLSDIAFFEDRKQPFSVSELIKHIDFHIAQNEDTISYRLFKATDDFKRFLDECAASAIADYNSTKESYLADVALIKERALESTNGNEEQTISKEKWSEIINGIL